MARLIPCAESDDAVLRRKLRLPSRSDQHVSRDDEHERREGRRQAFGRARQTLRDSRPEQNAEHAAADEHEGERPVDQARRGVIDRRRQSEGRDGDERGAHGVEHRHPGRADETRHDEKAAADAEEAREHARDEPIAEHFRRLRERALDAGRSGIMSFLQHENADEDHDEGEQKQKLLSVETLADRRSAERAE